MLINNSNQSIKPNELNKNYSLGNINKKQSQISTQKICVIIRKRPRSEREITNKDEDIISVNEEKNSIIVKEKKLKVDLTKFTEEHIFNFDLVFNEKKTNEQIYLETVRPMIQYTFSNNAKITCFAYGQTGSGKTFTMMGNNETNPGLYLLASYDIFSLIETKYKNISIYISFYEIYCGKLFDLLNSRKNLNILEDSKGQINIVGITEIEVNDLNSLINIINYGINLRSVGITGANNDSSRSHGIIQINLKDIKNKKLKGKISFIDLAGSERAKDTLNTNKQTKFDGAEINKSLLALKECIRALDQEKRHKPFRGSKLTLVLRDSFIGNCLTLMIANISPCLSCSEHTLNTLRYADRVKELRKPKHERDLTPNKKDPNDVLADLLMMPRQHNKALKYTVEIKKNGNVSASNFTNHNYNYNHLKNNQKDYYNEGNINIQKPANDIMKIDDLIKNENIPLKKDLKNSNNGNSGNNSSSRKNNLKNRPFTSNQNNRNNYISNNNYQNKYCNYQRKPINKDNSFEEKQNKELNADEYVSIYKDVKITSDEEYQQLSNLHEDLINNILTEEESFISKHKSHIDDMVDSLKKVKIKFFIFFNLGNGIYS